MAARDSATVQWGRQRIVVIDVTRSAGHGGVPIGEWKPCCAVVECCGRPTHRRMTYRTVPYRKLRTRRGMHRIICLLPGRQMAAGVAAAVQRGRQVIIVIHMARSAGHAGMPIREWEPCYAVIEWRPCPTIHCMAR
jgi:hypothetical protein